MTKARTKTILRTITLLITIFSLSFPVYAQYSGGTGEPNDPYQIATAEDLMLLGETPEDYNKHFILTADIDLDPNLPGRKVFDRAVIAPLGTVFTGDFNGNDHTILHLTIEGSIEVGGFLGLFGQTGSGVKVSNLGLEAVDVSGMGDHVGGLVGLNHEDGSITNCYSTGSVRGDDFVGGLVGSSIKGGSITASYSTGTVTGNEFVGGLVGCNDSFSVWFPYAKIPENPPSRVADCFSNSTVTGDYSVGGLVGVNCGQGSITSSYNAGSVNGIGWVGGLVGLHGSWWVSGIPMKAPPPRVADCFSNSTVTGLGYVGGLVGMNYDVGGNITNSYSTGSVNRSGAAVGGYVGLHGSHWVIIDDSVGGLVGYNSGSITSSFWDIHTSGLTDSYGGTGLTTAEMQSTSTFLEAGWDFVDETENGTEDIWWILEGQDYPRLRRELVTEN